MKTSSRIIIAVAVSVIVTAGIMYLIGFEQQPQISQIPTSDMVDVDKSVPIYFEGTHDIKKIKSQKDLRGVLEVSALFDKSFYGYQTFRESMIFEEALVPQSSESIAVTASSAPSVQSAGVDYSTTNIQVENVDEPDYLKNDSRYVYIVSENTLSIIDAYPAESAKLVLKIALDIESQYIQNMFLNDDRVMLFYNAESKEEVIPEFDYIPRRSYSPVTHALIIDVSDKENPSILKDYSIDGYFKDARMIGDYAYLLTSINIDYQYPRFPVISENSIPIMTPDAFYFDNAESYQNFNTLTAIDMFGDTVNSETFLVGYTGTFYVSEDNFYLTYQQSMPFWHYEDSSQDKFFDVIVPLLSDDIQDKIRDIKNDTLMNPSAQWTKISEMMQESYNNMEKRDKSILFEKINGALKEYDSKSREEVRRTIIHKISIDKDEIKYVAKGSVPGRLLNQFSMDQNGDKFRIATTTEHYTRHQGIIRANAVYVLDEQMNILGGLDNIAPDESIYSARFIGDRLYMVTFQQIDPFFVIDLSEDTPEILGELKIPGFSNYLHPYDKDHIIGIGRDTKETGNGRVEQLGVKIALFNVANVNNPIVIDNVIIGDRYTHSNALDSHKAFFFDVMNRVLSVPISWNAKSLNEISDSRLNLLVSSNTAVQDTENLNEISDSKVMVRDYGRWSGFYVFDLDSLDGFSLKGTVTHSADSYYGMQKARTFHIGKVLYTVSDEYLKMNTFDNIREINSIRLENTGKFIRYLDLEETR